MILCSICKNKIEDQNLALDYPNIVCSECDKRALNREGKAAKHSIENNVQNSLDKALKYLKGHSDVWWATGEEIANHYIENYLPSIQSHLKKTGE